ncbi:MAG: carboxymuconolactone decarboxylase family protein [Chloroflexi bacterium]|nr:carboxymuconolactone decarboxylase family protein [Chloroflexota bacterium]
MGKTYPERHQHIMGLMGELGREIPGTMQGFSSLHRGALETGALNVKAKELIALGIAIAVRCDGCIAFHVHDVLKAGATEEEIHEAIGVAILMGGGPAVMYATEAYEALQQYKAEGVGSGSGNGNRG